ncbi:hypothetical protein [Ancylobacter sp. IITR112]|uniref:hypothetical protein n=1 Tax=Ancylobacter sp. IITR112 TaxID=3138073 RepID=UPI00352AB0A7
MPAPGPEALAVDLYDAYLPALSAGSHRLVVQQSLTYSDAGGAAKAHHYYRDETFLVRGPRFFLDESDIHARYPAPGATGDFNRHIPNIVLRKRALPWERELSLTGTARAPWMALFLLSEAEFQAQGGEAAVQTLAPETLFTANRRSADGTVLFPSLEPEPDKEAGQQRVSVIDLDRALAAALCPSADDLSRLAHVRQVEMGDKPRAAMHGAGEFPVICARRLPAAGAHLALLVSLEGWEELIEARLPEGPARLRFVLLARWGFTHDPDFAHSFPGLARRLSLDLLRSPAPPGLPASAAGLLATGHTPMAYRRAEGGAGLGWYRGPFAPAPVAPLPLDAIDHADAALILAPEDGSLTLSYAAAWQLGRLMALASPGFLAATRAFISDNAGPREVAFRLDTYMRTHLAAIRREWSAPAPAPGDDAAPPDSLHAVLRMAGWLRGLLRLDGVPFPYLVAGEPLLPAASLRFFHVDANWLLALATGALSLSGTATGEGARAGLPLRRLLSRLIERCEAGPMAEPDPPGDLLDRPCTGFLLRATLVSDWPGLETQVETAPAGARLQRLERLAPDVLLGLAEGRIARVTLKEPPEGLAFRLAPPREGVPEPDARGLFSPLARLTAEQALGLARPGLAGADPLSAAAFAAGALSSGSIQSYVWEIPR